MQTKFTITGMHCASCKRLIEDVVKDISGVEECLVDFEHGTATINHSDTLELSQIETSISELGDYTVKVI